MQRNFEEECEQALREAENSRRFCKQTAMKSARLTDWQSSGRLAYLPVNGVEVGSLITVGGSDERGHLLQDVRFKLLEAAAQSSLHSQESATSWTPLERSEDAPGEIQSLWRVHLGEDDLRPGVNIAEIVRDGKCSFIYYAGGPQPGQHSFPVDKISVRAIQLIKESGGTVTYNPGAQRADDVVGRRQITLPEGTHQLGESEANMAPQRFVLPDGKQLRLIPNWYTVELDIITGEGLE